MSDNIKEEIENKIIDLIISEAGSRLVVFKPEKSDKDLLVEKRGGYNGKRVSLNIYNEKPSNLQINAAENFYLVFVRFDIVKQDIDDNFWVIPSLSSKESDFSKFLTNKNNFVMFLMEELEKK